MDKLILPPDQTGYVVVSGKEVLRVQLDGGHARYRRDIIGAWSIVTAQWTLSREGYQYLTAFVRARAKNGALPFLADFYIESASIAEHTCYIIPETLQLISQSGLTFIVAAQLEVKPSATDSDYDDGVIVSYEEYGDQYSAVYKLLEQLVNININNIA